MRSIDTIDWRTPEELVEEGFRRSRVVMVNEAHDGMLRCVRTREVGFRLLPVAHRCGVRVLAMEAFGCPGLNFPRDQGYLGQPEMAKFVGEAEALGWSLFGYEADSRAAPDDIRTDTMSMVYTQWREREQARNLLNIINRVDDEVRVMVWGGWSHVLKVEGMMAGRFIELSGPEPFVIDQTLTVVTRYDSSKQFSFIEWARPALARLGGTAGFLADDSIIELPPGRDAVLLSLENSME
jgi:hypothetical protein